MQGILDSLQLALNALKDGHTMSLSKARRYIRDAAAIAMQEQQVELDDKLVAKVSGPMRRTWDAIASDATTLEGAGRLTEGLARELVLDANRMATYGGAWGAEADRLVGAACDQHGYAKVSRFLGRKVKLL